MRWCVRRRKGRACERHGSDDRSGNKSGKAGGNGHDKLLQNSVEWPASENLAEMATCEMTLQEACQSIILLFSSGLFRIRQI
jgi:hypothetical protein